MAEYTVWVRYERPPSEWISFYVPDEIVYNSDEFHDYLYDNIPCGDAGVEEFKIHES